MSKFSLSLLFILLSFFFMGEALAASSTCNFNGVTNVVFNNYDPFNASPNDSQGIVVVRCTYWGGRNVTMSIGPSPNSGGFNPRAMILTAGTDLMNYNLFTTSSRNTIWGDGTQGTSTVTQYCPRNQNVNFRIYGRVPAGQDVSVGNYSETLLVTILF